MANLPDKVLKVMLQDHEFQRFTERTVTNAKDYEAELAFVRENGYGKNDREQYDTIVGIAAPVFDYGGEPCAVLNIWSAHPRYRIEDLIEWSGKLKAAAARVTDMIGGIMPGAGDLKAS